MKMREILFRGKRTDNGTWAYGYLFCIWERTYLCWGTTNDVPNMKEVIPETIGQYTGLTDRNGKKIFEGDIVNVIYTSSLGEEFTQITTVRYDETECCFYPMRWEEYCVNCDYSTEIIEIIVISNIHDSPKLLGEEENESDSR